MRPMQESPFSLHFNRLIWMGGWLPETGGPRQKHFFFVYKSCLNVVCFYGVYLLLKDFYMVFGDLKKTVWNLCVTILFLGSFTKMLQIAHRKEKINDLRMRLHQSAESKDSLEYAPIHNLALKQMRYLRLMLYGSATVFIPIWLVTRYLGQVKELPIPLHLPFESDLEDERQFTLAFVLSGCSGIYGLVLGMEIEMAMYSLFIQLEREYRFLIKDIPKLNLLYSKSGFIDYAEVNPWLRKTKVQMLLKDLYSRQKELIDCVKVFENCYSHTFLQQLFGVSILITLLGLQCTLETVDVFGSLMYQMGYLSVVLVNLFLLCWFSTRLKLLCCEVGEVAYSTHWYRMDLDTQKGLVMIILRSQHPPKLTTAGLMEINVTAFMNSLSNICSWLVLLRELQVNTVSKKTS